MKILAFLSLIYAIVTEVISFLEAKTSINYSGTLWVMSYAKKERCLEENRADLLSTAIQKRGAIVTVYKL